MTRAELQDHLRLLGLYTGLVDGMFGRLTEAAVLKALTRVDETPLTARDYADSAARLGIEPAVIRAFATVESGGKSGFQGAKPLILFEPHVFSRLTGHGYDASHPRVSYPTWGAKPYPPTQAARYDQLLEAVALDPGAGFSACSWGAYQIMGSNARMCGFASSFDFAHAMADGETAQLRAFEAFVKASGLVSALKAKDWREAARRYNGPGAVDVYAPKLAAAYHAAGGQ